MSSDPDTLDRDASVLMKRGIELMQRGDPAAAEEALTSFDEALALRKQLPLDQSPDFRYGLAACWLNRAEALMRLGSDARMAAALTAYDEAIAVLGTLPMDADSRYSRRLAIAHQNRGLALAASGGTPRQVIGALNQALAALECAAAAALPDHQFMSAVVWMNLANALATDPSGFPAHQTRDAATRAIHLIAHLEQTDPNAAEVGIKARHLLCQVFARALSSPPESDEALMADVHAATDAVDDGLEIVRAWERQGLGPFRALACDLVRFGARVYARFQPQFLEEFIRENLDPEESSTDFVESPEMRVAAQDAASLIARLSH